MSGNSDKTSAVVGLEIIPTGKALGAEIRGIDFSREVSPETREALLKAWADNLVLLFRNQSITEEQHLAATRVFGEAKVGAAKTYIKAAGVKER